VLLALSAAKVAGFSAQRAKLARKSAVARHNGGGESADIGAIAVQADALRHVLNIGFGEAGGSTVLARGGTTITSFDAILEMLVGHTHLSAGGCNVCTVQVRPLRV
jgi:hypothetical protein